MAQDQPVRITTTFVRSPLHRVIHGSGVWGGLTPQGELRISFFNEMLTLPDAAVYDVTPSQSGSSAISEVVEERIGGQGPDTTREIEVDVVVSINVARSIHRWIGEKLTEYDRIMESRGQGDQTQSS